MQPQPQIMQPNTSSVESLSKGNQNSLSFTNSITEKSSQRYKQMESKKGSMPSLTQNSINQNSICLGQPYGLPSSIHQLP